MKKEPKVSIIIPVYNGENYLKQAIDSALSQTYKNVEIIVVNDGSTDNTEKIILEYGNKIRYFEKENGGVSTALNLAIEKMTGDYFSWLSHDDLYKRDKISTQIEEILNCDNKTILFSDYTIIDENGTKKGCITLDHDKITEHPGIALLNCLINGITLLIPKKAFEVCGNFKPVLKCTQDYDLWFRMLLKGYHFHHIGKSLVQTRVHPKQTTNTSPVMIKEGNELWTNLVADYPIENKIKMSGSEYGFYKEMALFLSSCPYERARKYCIQQCNSIDKYKTKGLKKELKEELKKYQPQRNYNPFYLAKRLFVSFKNRGFKNTMRTIKKFVLGG